MVLPPPLPLLLSLLLLSSPPQAPTPSASAPMRQPVAANQREFKEPSSKGFDLGGDSTHAHSGRATEWQEARQIAAKRRTRRFGASVIAPVTGQVGHDQPRGG